MDQSFLVQIYATIGFLLAAYSVVANDSVQTLGTFIASNSQKFKWYYLWMAASSVLLFTLWYGWSSNGGDNVDRLGANLRESYGSTMAFPFAYHSS